MIARLRAASAEDRLLLIGLPLLVAALLSGWGTAVLSDAGGHLWVSAGPLQLTSGSIAAGAAIVLLS